MIILSLKGCLRSHPMSSLRDRMLGDEFSRHNPGVILGTRGGAGKSLRNDTWKSLPLKRLLRRNCCSLSPRFQGPICVWLAVMFGPLGWVGRSSFAVAKRVRPVWTPVRSSTRLASGGGRSWTLACRPIYWDRLVGTCWNKTCFIYYSTVPSYVII